MIIFPRSSLGGVVRLNDGYVGCIKGEANDMGIWSQIQIPFNLVSMALIKQIGFFLKKERVLEE
jgi:hypothetical protein